MRFGMDFGGTNLKVGLYENDGTEYAFLEEKLSRFTEQGDLLTNLIEHATQFIANQKVQAGGLAIKGLVDSKKGMLLQDIGAGELLAGKPLQTLFEKALGFPFIIDNDARAYMLGEWKFGAGKDFSTLVCMTLGTGLGCAQIINDAPYYGSDAVGGLLGGHLSIDKNGPECVCGQKGCFELYCSATALNKRVKNHLPQFNAQQDALPAFFAMVEDKNSAATELFNSFIEDLSIGVVNVIHAYNPQLVIIGGGVMNSSHLIIPALTKQVHKRAWTFPRKKVQIKTAELGNRAATMGIAFHPNFNLK